MSGIVFLKTLRLADIRQFYLKQIGCHVWLDQADCTILKHGNFLFGFCQRDKAESDVMLTFFYDTKEEVDRMYERLKSVSISSPSQNDKYRIYQFFARDPEGRTIEFQCFDHPVATYRCGDELLLTRRSVRHFEPKEIPDDILKQVLDISRYAPTSRNTQSYYFKLIGEKETRDWLASLREKSTAPIGRAPMAIAICSDPDISKRHIQDGCIAAYHFILTAWYFGLGTCWIAAMDRDDVKEKLNIPRRHYVATITPLGYPNGSHPTPPPRKELSEFIRS